MTSPSDDPITRLNAALDGRYRIERAIGEGGMALVYLAHDVRHNRNVALKVLRPELAALVGAERFLTEIQTTANLQHPHILPLFDSGEADGFLYFVMPYVEGDTLRDKIDREKQLNVQEALKITEKVASALDHAHKHGVVHRDIKPSNILLSPEGEPTIADFGIALAVAHAGSGRVTETGLSLGTPHYMSPEQATGDRDVDPRTDVYALGCVLYEMLTGDPPYGGSTAQAVLAKILTDPAPAPTRARMSIPPNVDAAIRKALEKLPADRFGSAQEFAKALEDPGFRHAEALAAAAPEPTRARRPGSLVAYALALLFAGAFAWSFLRPGPPAAPSPIRRFEIDLPEGTVFRPNTVQPIGITADGESVILNVATVESNGATSQLFMRSLADIEMVPIRGTEGIGSFFVSPDGEWVGFNSPDETLMRVPTGGGPAATIAETPGSFPGFRGASWGDTGMIVYAAGSYRGLMRVPDVGGVAEPLTAPERDSGESHMRPYVLPGGGTVLFVVARTGEPDQVAALSVESGEYEILTSGEDPHYLEGGFLVVRREDALWAAAFDPVQRTLLSDPVPVLEGLRGPSRFFALSGSGTLVYAEGSAGAEIGGRQFVVIDLEGNETVLPLAPREIPALGVGWSPDGQSIAFASEGEIYTYNVVLGTTPRQLTFEGDNYAPVYSPDGDRVAFSSLRGGTNGFDLFVKSLNDDSPARPILTLDSNQTMMQWPSDRLIVFWQEEPGSTGFWTVDLTDPENPTAEIYLSSERDLASIAISPDGTLAAYRSDESGTNEIYIRSFPNPGEPTVVSRGGGLVPYWAPDGSTLYYGTGPGRPVIAAHLQLEPVPVVLSVDTLGLRAPAGSEPMPGSALHPDGDRFIHARDPNAASPDAVGGDHVILVENFGEVLRQAIRN